MKTLLFIFGLNIMLIFGSYNNNDNPVNNDKLNNEVSLSTDISSENYNLSGKIEKSPCIIKRIIYIDHKPYIIVDFTTSAGSSEISNNPIFENKNTDRLRIFLISKNTRIKCFPTWRRNYDGEYEYISVYEFLEHKDEQISDFTKWVVVAKDGIVLELSEIYFA